MNSIESSKISCNYKTVETFPFPHFLSFYSSVRTILLYNSIGNFNKSFNMRNWKFCTTFPPLQSDQTRLQTTMKDDNEKAKISSVHKHKHQQTMRLDVMRCKIIMKPEHLKYHISFNVMLDISLQRMLMSLNYNFC